MTYNCVLTNLENGAGSGLNIVMYSYESTDTLFERVSGKCGFSPFEFFLVAEGKTVQRGMTCAQHGRFKTSTQLMVAQKQKGG
jgi:hypothetical protein